MSEDAISCELHDFVEVVCMYRYQLKLSLKNNQVVEGKAIDIVNSTEGRECLLIDGNPQQQVELTQITKMEVLTPNAKFREVDFE
ncbi:MAG: transcriptional regulator [Nitrosomonas sp.]|nr:MAG: transcriptional regulator [Nitrosomonas sp.]